MRMEWNNPLDKRYESGVDRAVLFLQDGTGVPWNGLISVSEKPSVKITPFFFDGHKHNDAILPGPYQGTIKAFTYPDEFLALEGVSELEKGFFVYDQPQKRFNLCYRTFVGNQVEGQSADYKIHVVYNCLAKPAVKNYKTLTNRPSASTFSWNITTVPQSVDGYTATSHACFDTRFMDPYLIADIEDIIYGSDNNLPTLPTLQGLSSYIRKWARVIITDNLDGTWEAASSFDGQIVEHGDGTFTINDANTSNVTADQFDITSSVVDAGDI